MEQIITAEFAEFAEFTEFAEFAEFFNYLQLFFALSAFYAIDLYDNRWRIINIKINTYDPSINF